MNIDRIMGHISNLLTVVALVVIVYMVLEAKEVSPVVNTIVSSIAGGIVGFLRGIPTAGNSAADRSRRQVPDPNGPVG